MNEVFTFVLMVFTINIITSRRLSFEENLFNGLYLARYRSIICIYSYL